ncbi:MAG: TatD family deoxyribonuclease [Betaproteobacteria bacterium]|nr:TatD family deoxyribonuclease [Betaproteobacteria bacterium]
MVQWIDTHCHLDAPEFAHDVAQVVTRAREAGVHCLVLPAVRVQDAERVRALAHAFGAAYALGIHPLAVPRADEADLQTLAEQLDRWCGDPRLVAVGEIGLDHFVAHQDLVRQTYFYEAQLKLAQQRALPVLLHVRRSADALLKGLRRCPVVGGIAHAFNGSHQQAQAFVDLGFALGFGGTLTFERSRQIRRLASDLPAQALVLETDAPDIPPQGLYRPAAVRHAHPPARNEPFQVPCIGQVLANLRGWSLAHTARVTSDNAHRVLPRLAQLHEALG